MVEVVDDPGTSPCARKIASAIAKSNNVPLFLTSAGAKFTAIRVRGNAQELCLSALRTRSRASCTAASGSPTTINAPNPGEISAST